MEFSPRISKTSAKGTLSTELEKSILLLDDALSSPGKSLLRVSRKTPQRISLGTRIRGDGYGPDVYGAGHTPRKFLRHAQDISVTLGPDELSAFLCVPTDSVLHTEQVPWRNAADKLYGEFLEALQSYGSEQQAFDIVGDFIQTCSDTLDVLRDMERKVLQKMVPLSHGEEWLQNERNTWRLVYCLYQNRISSHFLSEDGMRQQEEAMNEPLRHLNEKEIVQQLYKSDSITRECQLVIDWLEQNASEQTGGEACLQHFTDKTVAWENTLHQLQNDVRHTPYASSRPIVTKLDPDAPLREGKPLHDIDMEDEARLVKEVFVQIRGGNLEQAQALCMHTGQEWRAAALEGWRLHHDPNYKTSRGIDEVNNLPIEGNPNRDIWKLMAWQIADDKRVPVYTRATFAALCGHLSALVNVCQSWEDLLWAHFRVLVDIKVEREIRESSVRQYIKLPDVYWQNEMDIEEVFSELAASKDTKIRSEAQNITRKVQQYLIMDQVGTLMDEMEQWIRLISDPKPQSLRFLSHLVIVLRLIGRAEKDHIGDVVLRAYVRELMKMRDPHLVAHYVTTLPQEDQVTLYAEFLTDITDSGERELALKAAENADLDIETVTKRVVEKIRNRETSIELPDLQAEITAEDMMKVSALDWVTYYPSQRAEAVWQANAIICYFLAVNKLEAARKAFNKIPLDSIDLIMKRHQGRTDDSMNVDGLSMVNNLPARVSSSIREYLCYKAYLGAEESFSDWFHHYHHAKPTAPKLPSGEVPFTEKVAYDHRHNQYKSELERWKMAMQQQTKTVKSQLYNILMFPEGGWLVDCTNSEAEDSDVDMDGELSRHQKQMDDLRQLCIPKVVLLLHTAMHQMGEYAECIQLANLIVSEQHKLYKVFTKSKLGELLSRITESSLALLDQKRDPWGHPVSS